MFNNFKKKINSVIQDGLQFSETVSANLKVPSSPKFTDSQTTFVPNSVNLFAGREILEKNERNWSALHTLNEENASRASQINEQILTIRNRSDKLFTDVSDLNISLVSLPTVINALNGCMEVIDDIGKMCRSFEAKLYDLEDLLDVLELQERQLDHRFEMAMYKEKKLAELDKKREELAAKHASNVKDYEINLRKVQKERQLAFQDAFQDDLKIYKEKGVVPKVEHKSVMKELSLEEIVLDDREQDNQALDDFLKD